jgi:hypothetical protein
MFHASQRCMRRRLGIDKPALDNAGEAQRGRAAREKHRNACTFRDRDEHALLIWFHPHDVGCGVAVHL